MSSSGVSVASHEDDASQLRKRTAVSSEEKEPLINKELPKKVHDGSLFSDLGKLESTIAPIVFTVLALFTRLYQIGKSSSVTWDEAHFGKFGSYYLKREYYFDVHPPLGKMLVGLSGFLANYNGSFSFDSGSAYPEDLDYTTMRVFNALFNVGCVPVAYYTAKALKLSTPAVWLVTLMILFENSYITLGKLILLDSMLVFFTFTTVLGLAQFHNLQNQSFSKKWWTTLILTGLSIGAVCSVKMVGLFVTAVVGVYTVVDLWTKFGDTKMPVKTYFAHWISRIITLIVIPLLVFALCFKIHFTILNHSGPGDANMSSLFQANLIGSDINGGPTDVAFGSRITLKNMDYKGGLLHSHVQGYPEGSEQQQITTYHHKDANNEWFIEHKRYDEYYNDDEEIHFIKNGDTIRLIHPSTGRNLHSHQLPAPVTKVKYEVSCYGNLTIGDEKDNWVVEIAETAGSDDPETLHPLTSAVRFRHQELGCYLSAEGNNLPPWGFRQGEVTCDPHATFRNKKTWWNVENHWNERLPESKDRVLPKTSFLKDFIQLNIAMMASNNALVPDEDKQDDLASEAWQWPTLDVGLRLCGWGDDNVRYFLLGNPFVTWATTAGLGTFALLVLFYLVRWQRQYNDFTLPELAHVGVAGFIPAIGWFFHFLPFVVMARVTYVHHYLPALYFAILTFGFQVDFLTSKARNSVKFLVYFILYALTTAVFVIYAPISFGMTGPVSNFSYLNIRPKWRI